jgi:hypothetical protein
MGWDNYRFKITTAANTAKTGTRTKETCIDIASVMNPINTGADEAMVNPIEKNNPNPVPCKSSGVLSVSNPNKVGHTALKTTPAVMTKKSIAL